MLPLVRVALVMMFLCSSRTATKLMYLIRRASLCSFTGDSMFLLEAVNEVEEVNLPLLRRTAL